MKKIQSLEDEGVSTRNFKWDGWDPLEFDEAFLQQKKMREKAAIEDEKEAKMAEKFITLERREFEEAEKRRAEEDGEPDAFVSDKEQDRHLDVDSQMIFLGKTREEIDDYFQNGPWPDKTYWRKGFKNFLSLNRRSRKMVIDRIEKDEKVQHKLKELKQDWYLRKNKLVKIEGVENIGCALHLDFLEREARIEKHGLKIVDKTDVGKRCVQFILFNRWEDLRKLKLTEIRGSTLYQVSKEVIAEYSDHKAPPKVIAFGSPPNEHRQKLLRSVRKENPLRQVRLVLEAGIDKMEKGAIIRSASLAGVNSVFQLDYPGFISDNFNAATIRGSAGLIYTLPLYQKATISRNDYSANIKEKTNVAKKVERHIDPFQLAVNSNPDYEPAVFLINSQEDFENTGNEDLGHIEAVEIHDVDWTYPNIMIVAADEWISDETKRLLKEYQTIFRLVSTTPTNPVFQKPPISLNSAVSRYLIDNQLIFFKILAPYSKQEDKLKKKFYKKSQKIMSKMNRFQKLLKISR